MSRVEIGLMNDALRYQAETLLREADQAVDRTNNGLWDREDCIVLLGQFATLLRNLMQAQERLESDRGELARRLQRRYLPAEAFPNPLNSSIPHSSNGGIIGLQQ